MNTNLLPLVFFPGRREDRQREGKKRHFPFFFPPRALLQFTQLLFRLSRQNICKHYVASSSSGAIFLSPPPMRFFCRQTQEAPPQYAIPTDVRRVGLQRTRKGEGGCWAEKGRVSPTRDFYRRPRRRKKKICNRGVAC